ncbi:hypothetical protein EMIHUDRAFT_121994 [Emiliania huxleyi CCMP1516]|uniref:Uncharacterized protein n=2 Tax=Emiliania huxleyi TaxID=2903 RepID=A0A0D3KWC6_EMIH1|nr:hypothetical protein EMIHUDRAFT_121994 [Emiliania huxleyi CCMP1516]EOD40061.1 hypothetical protein EMIHUDRAFT_121994 [Emiliania huxleyi CCMP1516]|eukprot:XP_005792490.1 hypothetical protein EMIHUDRAFT_121994 [Emiliania huxleyi CCMP1516]
MRTLRRRRAAPPGSETLDVGGWQVVVTDGHAVLPEGMTHLPDRAFRHRTSLVSVACPRGSLPWEHAPPADIPAAKRAATASQLSEGLPREAAVAVEALLRPPRGAGGEVDHAALLRTLRLAAGSDGGEEGEGEQGEGMDWQRLGLSWRADGAILDAGGELVRRPAG